jgi:hypothetical protein
MLSFMCFFYVTRLLLCDLFYCQSISAGILHKQNTRYLCPGVQRIHVLAMESHAEGIDRDKTDRLWTPWLIIIHVSTRDTDKGC